MTKKVFISYSHKDEKYRSELEDHLSLLRRNKVIDIWHDRKIIPGEGWKGDIDENLESADIILFLISPSFLGSDYCNDVEVEKALQLESNGSAKVVSIILHKCHWQDSPLSELQALPKDANPVTSSSWDDVHAAWYDVVDGLKKVISTFNQNQKKLPLHIQTQPEKVLKTEFSAWLDDTEVVLTHRMVDRVMLRDIFIWPDLRDHNDDDTKRIDYVSSHGVLFKPERYLLLGDEQQGKTALLKYMFTELVNQGKYPIYLDAKTISNSKIEDLVRKALRSQYENLEYETFIVSPDRVIFIDNIDQIKLNERYQTVFIERVNDLFNYVVVTAHDSFGLVSTENLALSEYKIYELLGFGHAKREEMIVRWVSLEVEESINEQDLYSSCDELKVQLNTIIKKNIVPPKPLYVLLLLQMFEAYANQNLELTSYGHCYQQLIYNSFDNAGIKKNEFDMYLNVLTEIAWEIHLNGGLALKTIDVEEFFTKYEANFLPVDHKAVLSRLVRHSILKDSSDELRFKYPYIYYFFVGKKMAESYIDSSFVQEQVEKLLQTLHREDSANILIFITHHTKNKWVLDKIKVSLDQVFDENDPASLTLEQLSFMSEFVSEIPELVIEKREVVKERDNHNRRLDDIERNEQEDESDESEEFEEFDTLANINKTFKSMEIAGQIIRNRYANLNKENLLSLAESGANAGLRCLDYFIEISDYAKLEIVRHIEKKLEEHPALTDKELQKYAKSAYLYMTYGVINGIIKKIASSIGSKDAMVIYESLEKEKDSPAYLLIRLAIELQHKRVLDMKSIEAAKNQLSHNPVCMRIMKEMVVQYIYMFPVNWKDQQKLASSLRISVEGQQRIKLKGKGRR
ncbi:toll/interleukin-1 receptor domain-containing protein [Hydrogenovibrio kuenenii]|uniref:toll/interleukin-1 receptor domain-containing protein n=1 Tax=Hydrogenovibrio kuenenii TaxID=63658 RepID=UPI000463557E|nr:toll/interleukin-1 receptor domain-containing protein [Hydrogenovibrio kuenenii]